MAGGNTYEVFNAGAYNATKFAKQGDLGTKVSVFAHMKKRKQDKTFLIVSFLNSMFGTF